MKLIFNKTDEGLKEMQKYFSHIPGQLDFEDFEADIVVAQEEVARYIGMAMIEKAINHYWTPVSESSGSGSGSSETDNLNELVLRVQSAVTLMAYRDYAQNKDATHTSTGRTARSDKDSDELNLKLIDQDDMALQRKGLKAMDRLIKFVDDHQFKEWTDSIAYKECRDLLIWNADLFEKYFPIERSRRVFLMLVPMIRKAQFDHILPRVGAEAFGVLLEKVKAGDLADPADRLLYDLICYPIAEMAISEAFSKLPTQLFTENMTRQFWNAGNGAAALVLREKLIGDIESRGKQSLLNLESELERRAAATTNIPITDEVIVDIADRMDSGNAFVRV